MKKDTNKRKHVLHNVHAKQKLDAGKHFSERNASINNTRNISAYIFYSLTDDFVRRGEGSAIPGGADRRAQ